MFSCSRSRGGTASGQVATGIPPFSSNSGSSFDTVDNANLNVHFSIPGVAKAGRGLPFDYVLSFDSSVWSPVSPSGGAAWTPVTTWGWRGITEAITGYVSYDQVPSQCPVYNPDGANWWSNYYAYSNFVFHDNSGGLHPYPANVTVENGDSQCGQSATSWTGTALDGSGYTLTASGGSGALSPPSANVFSSSGVNLSPPLGGPSGFGTVTDPNGNQLGAAYSGGTTTFTDSLGLTPLTVSGAGTPASPLVYAYPNPSGGTSQVTVEYTASTVGTNFGCSGISEFKPAAENLVSSIVVPDGTSYNFTYDSAGRITSATLPTGGTIHYAYSGGKNGILCSDGSTATLTRTTPDGQWTYTHTENGSDWTTTVTDPQGNQTVYQFQGIYETERQIYQGSGTLLETVDTCYNGASAPCTGTAVTLPITQRSVTVTTDTNLKSETVTDYSAYGLPSEVEVYGYGSGAVGPLVRQTIIGYDTSLGNIKDRPGSVTVEDGSGNHAAATAYGYDSSGNLTSLNEYYNAVTTIARYFSYGSYGVLQTATDFDGHTTTFTNSACTDSFPTSVAEPLSLTSSLAWNCNTGLVTSVTDPNSQTTSFSYDDLYRLIQTNDPDGGQVSTAYNDRSSPLNVVTTTKLNSSQNRTDTALIDGLGRVTETQLNSDPAGVDKIDTAYDSLGRVASVANPYRSASTGEDTYSYDALGRMTKDQYADGDYSGAYYGSGIPPSIGRSTPLCSGVVGYPMVTWDGSGHDRETWTDAFGQVAEVDEPDPANNSLTDANANATCYAYDVLGNLTGIAQGGQTRSYTYDMLSRLVSATTPESGTTTYSYSASGSPCSGDPSNVCTRTDARGVATTYTYDALNRLTSKSYSDHTPVANFWYDYNSATFGNWTQGSLTNTKGRLYATCTSNAIATCPAGYTGTVYSYDSMGRIVNYWQATPYNEGTSAWQMTYNYDLAGDITSWTHPAGFTITNTINGAQEITQITSSLVDATHPQYLAKDITYTPWGAEQTLENGCASSSGQETGCTDTLETYVYNNRLQPVMIELGNTSNPSADYSLAYNYAGSGNPPCTITQGAGDDGTVTGYTYTDNVNPGLSHTATYCYDALSRLTQAIATGNSTYNLTFEQGSGPTYLGYDRYGNMKCVNNGQTSGPCPQYSFSSANSRITNSGFTYDAAGDLTSDGTYTYQYDGEGRLVSLNSSSTPSWSYNALGDRTGFSVPWATGDVLFTPGGQLLSYWDRTYNDWGFERFWLNGRMMAYYNPDAGTMRFEHVSGLDSATMVTDQTGGLVTDQLFYPWGEFWEGADTEDPTFASLLGDDRTYGLYPAEFREYTSHQGRWLSPDPLGGDITNPQSLNRYAYVLNNPTTFTDPSGLDPSGCTSQIDQNGNPYVSCSGPDTVTVNGGSPPSLWLTLFADFYLGSWPNTPINFPSPFSHPGGGRVSPPPEPAPSSSPLAQRFGCAANFGDAHSLASLLGVQNNIAGQIAFGNTASALTHLAFSIAGANSSITETQIANIVLSGTRQGIPGGGPGSQGAAGLGQKAAIGAAVSAGYNTVAGVGAEPIELGITASGKVASVAVPLSEGAVSTIASAVTVAKFAYDLTDFGVGYYECGR